MKTFAIIISILFAVTFNITFAENIIVNNDIEYAQQLSKEKTRPLILIFSADYCHFCQQLKDDMFSSDIFESNIICIIDIQNNKPLSRKFRIRNLPTSIIMNDDFTEKSRITGYKKKEYIDWLNSHK